MTRSSTSFSNVSDTSTILYIWFVQRLVISLLRSESNMSFWEPPADLRQPCLDVSISETLNGNILDCFIGSGIILTDQKSIPFWVVIPPTTQPVCQSLLSLSPPVNHIFPCGIGGPAAQPPLLKRHREEAFWMEKMKHVLSFATGGREVTIGLHGSWMWNAGTLLISADAAKHKLACLCQSYV